MGRGIIERTKEEVGASCPRPGKYRIDPNIEMLSSGNRRKGSFLQSPGILRRIP